MLTGRSSHDGRLVIPVDGRERTLETRARRRWKRFKRWNDHADFESRVDCRRGGAARVRRALRLRLDLIRHFGLNATRNSRRCRVDRSGGHTRSARDARRVFEHDRTTIALRRRAKAFRSNALVLVHVGVLGISGKDESVLAKRDADTRRPILVEAIQRLGFSERIPQKHRVGHVAVVGGFGRNLMSLGVHLIVWETFTEVRVCQSRLARVDLERLR